MTTMAYKRKTNKNNKVIKTKSDNKGNRHKPKNKTVEKTNEIENND